MATKGRRQRNEVPSRTLSEEEWRQGLRHAVTNLHEAAARLRAEIERTLEEPDSFPERRRWDLPSLPRLAAALRLAIGNGQGNRLLFRACDRFGLSQPTVGGHVAVTDPGGREVLAYAEPESGGGQARAIQDCMALTCLVVRDASISASWTWSQLISEVANKAGAHLDDERPISWDLVGQYEILGVPVVPRLLYQLGRIIAKAGADMLDGIGEPTDGLDGLPQQLGGGTAMQVQISEN